MKFETTVIITIPTDIVGVMATITVSDSVPDTSLSCCSCCCNDRNY